MAPNSQFRLEGRRVWVAGHRGMVGSALVRRLASEGCEVLTVGHAELDLRRQADVERWMKSARPEAVIIAAARVGGILENSRRPAEFLHDNIAMQDEHHQLRRRDRRREAAVPRLVLRLPAARAAAHIRRLAR